LGIDSNVLVAFLVPDHPDHRLTRFLTRRRHAVNPTVIHETYHTCVFKLNRRPEDTIEALLNYLSFSLCLSINLDTVELALKLAVEHHLGGRDALILASYASSEQTNTFVTFDQSLLAVKQVKLSRRRLKITDPRLIGNKIVS
jgi:predicted nucleic acid-binding protein